nr:immunoglobulin heavy chain junction region [Macaca mulatta]
CARLFSGAWAGNDAFDFW